MEHHNLILGYVRYRADVPDHGAGSDEAQQHQTGDAAGSHEGQPGEAGEEASKEPMYKLQKMKWGGFGGQDRISLSRADYSRSRAFLVNLWLTA